MMRILKQLAALLIVMCTLGIGGVTSASTASAAPPAKAALAAPSFSAGSLWSLSQKATPADGGADYGCFEVWMIGKGHTFMGDVAKDKGTLVITPKQGHNPKTISFTWTDGSETGFGGTLPWDSTSGTFTGFWQETNTIGTLTPGATPGC
jgi:hypothetical protein